MLTGIFSGMTGSTVREYSVVERANPAGLFESNGWRSWAGKSVGIGGVGLVSFFLSVIRLFSF